MRWTFCEACRPRAFIVASRARPTGACGITERRRKFGAGIQHAAISSPRPYSMGVAESAAYRVLEAGCIRASLSPVRVLAAAALAFPAAAAQRCSESWEIG